MAGLRAIAHYVDICRATVLRYVSERLIKELCMDTKRKLSTGKKTYWVEQEMDLKEDKARPATATTDDGLDFQ